MYVYIYAYIYTYMLVCLYACTHLRESSDGVGERDALLPEQRPGHPPRVCQRPCSAVKTLATCWQAGRHAQHLSPSHTHGSLTDLASCSARTAIGSASTRLCPPAEACFRV